MADTQHPPQQIVGQTDQKLDEHTNRTPRQINQDERLWTIIKLMDRYGIGKGRLIKRMAYLKILPRNMGNHSYLDNEQLAYMDEFHAHIQQTGRTILLHKLRGVIS